MNPLAPVTKTFVRRPPMCSYISIGKSDRLPVFHDFKLVVKLPWATKELIKDITTVVAY